MLSRSDLANSHYRAKMAHITTPRPDSGLEFQVEVFILFYWFIPRSAAARGLTGAPGL